MVDEPRLKYVHRRRRASEAEEPSDRTRPEPAARQSTPSQLESLGGEAALIGMENVPKADALKKPARRTAEYLPRDALCEQLKIDREDFYRMVVAGDIVFARDSQGLLYKAVNPRNQAPGQSPSDTRELAARRPPRLGHIGALAAFIDELSRRLVNCECSLRYAEDARDEAQRLLRNATDDHTALSQQHVAVTERLRTFETSMGKKERAVLGWTAESRRLRDDLDYLLASLDDLARSPLALPIRKRLVALLGGWEARDIDDAKPTNE